MQELKQLINIALSWRVKHAKTLKYLTGSKKSMANKLISDIYEGKINTDKEAEKALYGKGHNPVAYKKLKERLRERLYTNILFTHASVRSQKTYAYNVFFCHKYYVIASILIKTGAGNLGTQLLQRVLARAQKFQITPVALLSASLLRKMCVNAGDKKAFEKYDAIVKKYHDIIKAEDEADELHDRLMIEFANSYAPKPELIVPANEAAAYIGKLKNAFDTFNLNLLYFLVKNLHAHLTDNYALSLAVCEEFETYFLAQPAFYSRPRHANIVITKVDCYLCLGRYKDGISLAQEMLPLYDTSANKYIMLELILVMALRQANVVLVTETYMQLKTGIESQNTHARQKELWQILGGYLWLFLSANNYLKLRDDIFDKQDELYMKQILHSPTVYNKDKQGVNISIGFLQYALLLQIGEYEKAIDKTEQLKTYMYKYISRRFGAREHTFLKLMLLLSKYNFDIKKAEKRANVLLQRLETLPIIAFAYNNTRVEILEYKQLWELILDQLPIINDQLSVFNDQLSQAAYIDD